jgi:hypothetical protein
VNIERRREYVNHYSFHIIDPDPTSGVGGHANREMRGLTCVNVG